MDPTAHAEILALREPRHTSTIAFLMRRCTARLEPCVMCAGALGQDLGVSGRVHARDRGIGSAAQDLASHYDYGAHGNLAGMCAAARQGESFVHELFVGGHLIL